MACQNESLVASKENENKVPYTVTRYLPSTVVGQFGQKVYQKERPRSYIPPLAIPGSNILKDPEALFLYLTQWTVPHGYEGEHYGPMLARLGLEQDEYGNWFREIKHKDGGSPTTAFTSHMDTADNEVKLITKTIHKGTVTTNGKTSLGADDRAGMTVLLYMLNQGVPGLYCFFVGEEAGCWGSRKASGDLVRFCKITKMISFDRKGTTSVITRQCGERTCSDVFAQDICKQLQRMGLIYRPDANGLFTDSKEFAYDIAECTNLSVGYGDAHGTREFQNVKFLKRLCIACLGVDWESLTVSRDADSEFDQWRRNGYHNSGWYTETEDDDDYETGSPYWREHVGRFYNGSDTWDYNDPNSAIERIVEDFQNGLPIDSAHLSCLICTSHQNTIANMELLMETLQDAVR